MIDEKEVTAYVILLPENLIKQGMYLFGLGEKIECLNKIYFPGIYKRFDALADFLGCSKKALAIRMKQLGLLKKEYGTGRIYLYRRLVLIQVLGEKRYTLLLSRKIVISP